MLPPTRAKGAREHIKPDSEAKTGLPKSETLSPKSARIPGSLTWKPWNAQLPGARGLSDGSLTLRLAWPRLSPSLRIRTDRTSPGLGLEFGAVRLGIRVYRLCLLCCRVRGSSAPEAPKVCVMLHIKVHIKGRAKIMGTRSVKGNQKWRMVQGRRFGLRSRFIQA